MIAATAITAGGLVLVAPPAWGKAPIFVSAPNPADIVTRHISFADLNLASAAGEVTLNRRVDVAVSGLCSDATGGDDGSLTVKSATQRCHSSAWNQARPQIGQAVQRARDLAFRGSSLLAAVEITIQIP
jgi:UrcA family protein